MEARAHWSGRLSFILAAAGSAIGLGNIWKFPYISGVNGGGVFVLVYLGCIALVGIPVFLAELYIGQQGQANAVLSFERLHRKGTPWRVAGYLGIAAAFMILGFYSVVGGWVLDFEFRALTGEFSASHSETEIQGYLGGLFHSPLRQAFWHVVFTVIVVAIVLGGIKNGIEKWNRILMPGLFLLLVLLFLRAAFEPGFPKAAAFLFSPDPSKLTPHGILEAVGHSFFTLSLGMGAMITYGSYLSERESLLRTVLSVALLDTFIALTAGMVIFSVVFSFGLDASAGPTLMFQTLPVLFSRMAGGTLIAVAFFLLISFAAVTSAVAILEVMVTYAVESRGISRRKATLGLATVAFLVGIPCALSTNVMADFKILGLTVFDLLDKASSSVALPLGGLIISLFYGWVLGPKAVAATLRRPVGHPLAVGLMWAARVLAPLGILATLINAFG